VPSVTSVPSVPAVPVAALPSLPVATPTQPAVTGGEGVAVVGETAPTAGPSGAAGTSAAPAAAAQQPPTAPPLAAQLADQLGARLTGLRAAGVGEHVLTLRVDPDTFGPVRVVAHITAEGVRVELLGATEAARDALRSALPDLRRDLADAGLGRDLDLGTGDRDGTGSERTDRTARDQARGHRDGETAGPGATDLTDPTRARLGGIDLLA
jgi:flagellar hook-length control protein FliK